MIHDLNKQRSALTATAMDKIAIILLCHNRPDDARQAIRSILAQTDRNFELTVSDNSSNDSVFRMVKDEFPSVHYVRRIPMLPAPEHFNRCIDEIRTDYFCLFHDDDVMGTDFVAEYRRALQDFPNAIAIGCNALIETFGRLESKPSFLSCESIECIGSARDLAKRYFSRSQSGIAPFPGYIYNKYSVDSQRFLVDGGKYADVTWLLQLCMKGPVLWIKKPLMTYRLHANNDGATESRRDRLRFLGFLKQNKDLFGRAVIQDYRCSFIYKTLVKSSSTELRVRYQIAQKFLDWYRWTRYGRLDTYQDIFKRGFIKYWCKA